jgi:hypothetical protein
MWNLMKNNAIFAKKRMIVHPMWVKNGRFGKVPRIFGVADFW